MQAPVSSAFTVITAIVLAFFAAEKCTLLYEEYVMQAIIIEKDRDFLVERSPRTHIDNIQCPLLVIQGKNDPRVIESESGDLVNHLRSIGKQVEYLVFENEGHDVLKFENRIRCYNAITDFFAQWLKP